MKKIIILCSAFIIAFATLMVTSYAVSYEGLDMTYSEETGELYISGNGTLTREALKIGVGDESTIDYILNNKLKSVVMEGNISEIGEEAFTQCNGLESIIINDGVKVIEKRAFSQCKNLKNIIIPDSVEKVADYAFAETPWFADSERPLYAGKVLLDYRGADETEVTVAEGTTMIYEDAFSGCSEAEAIIIPDTVTEIGDNAFWGCKSLSSIRLSENLKEIKFGTFSGCTSLSDFKIPASVEDISDAFDGMLWYENLSETTVINDIVVKCIPDENGVATIPDGAKYIRPYLFYNSNEINSVNIPVSVEKIGKDAFAMSGITSVNFEGVPDKGLIIEDYAFSNCGKLSSINLPHGVTSIGSYAFIRSRIKELIIPDTVYYIGNSIVAYMEIETHVYVPSTVTNIVYDAFEGKDVTVYTPKNSVAHGVAVRCGAKVVETVEDRVGEVYNTLISTDIITTMNGNKVNAYSIDGQTIILVRDLENIGFDVSFDEVARTAYANYNADKNVVQGNAVALPDDKVLYTDITVKINDIELDGFNIGGYMAVIAEDMGRYVPDISCTWVQSERALKMTASSELATIDYFINELAKVKGYEASEESEYFADARSPYTDALVDNGIIWKSEHDGMLYPDSGMTVYMFATYAGRAVYGSEYEKMAWRKECYTVPEIDYTNIPIYIQSYVTKLYEDGIFELESINGVNTVDVNRVMTKAEVTVALEKLITNEL